MDKVYSGLVDEYGNKIYNRYYSPSNISEKDKERIFEHIDKDCKYCVIYDEWFTDNNYCEVMRWGYPTTEKVNYGKAVNQNIDFFRSYAEAKERSEKILLIKNRNYKNPFIVER